MLSGALCVTYLAHVVRRGSAPSLPVMLGIFGVLQLLSAASAVGIYRSMPRPMEAAEADTGSRVGLTSAADQ